METGSEDSGGDVSRRLVALMQDSEVDNSDPAAIQQLHAEMLTTFQVQQ